MLKQDEELKESVMNYVSETAQWFKEDDDIKDFCAKWGEISGALRRERIMWSIKMTEIKSKLDET